MWSSHEGDNFLSSAPVTRLSVVRIVEVNFQEMFILGIQASMLLADAEGWHKARPVLRTLTKKTLSPIFNITILSMRLKYCRAITQADTSTTHISHQLCMKFRGIRFR